MKAKSAFTVYYQNVRGLRTKTNQLLMGSLSCDYEVVALTETWLNSDFASAEFFSSAYTVYRRDRMYEELDCQRGGGVLIAVSNSVQSSLISTTIKAYYDDIWIELRTPNATFIIACVYFAPNLGVHIYQSFCDCCEQLKNRYASSKFIIYGDFNLPHIDWYVEEDTVLVPRCVLGAAACVVLDTMCYLEMQQFNNVSNHCGRYIDLIFAED